VKLDGASAGAAPIAKRLVLDPGSHRLEIASAGFLPHQRTIVVGAGEDRAEKVALAPVPPPVAIAPVVVTPPPAPPLVPPASPLTAPAGVVPSVSLVSSREPAQAPDTSAHPIYGRWWFWAGVGAVVLGVASAVALTRGTTTVHSCPPEIPAARCFASQ